mmetsp:Transcript_8149/g.18901  ORF Transcript_8149/g.18901 Transcript_8149/m.18901 type:complete len:259 (-) Transcript_8149:1998-2774(-)
MHAVDGVARVVEGVSERVDAHGRRRAELDLALLVGPLAHRLEALPGGVHHAHRLLQALREVARDRHHLADGAHLGAELLLDARELGEVPAGVLDHAVVEGRLERRRGHLGDSVGDLVELDAEGELGRDGREGVAGRLGGERRRARETRVHLDDAVVLGVLVEGVLDVALADHAQMPHHLDSGVAKHVVVVVVQRLRGRHHDRLARVDPEGVEVLHVADSDAVAKRVAHNLVLDLLPPAQRLLNQHLWGLRERDVDQLR